MRKIEFGNIGVFPLAVALALGLTACGGGDGAFDGTPDTTTTTDTTTPDTTGAPSTGALTGAAKELVISYPQSNAIEDLQNGFYRRKAAVTVLDRDGNAVPDGTVVTLNLIDSVVAGGIIDSSDSITGSTLTDSGVTLGDGSTATAMDQAWVRRHNADHMIESGDPLFLYNADRTKPVAEAADVSRSADRTGITATSINVATAFTNTYPNTTYPAGNTEYVIGASLLGATVAGVDSDGNLTSGASATVDGIANFVITYPNNSGAIMTGCGDIPSVDTRTVPLGAARVYLVAQVNGQPEVTVVSDDFCFSRIAGGTLTPSPSDISSPVSSGSPIDFTVNFRDGGDAMVVPFVRINYSVDSSGGASVDLGNYSTDSNGNRYYRTDEVGNIYPQIVTATGASGDTADITFTVAGEPDVTATVKYTIP